MQEATLVRWLNHAIRYPEDLSINGRHLATITTTSSSLEDEEGMDLLVGHELKHTVLSCAQLLKDIGYERAMIAIEHASFLFLHS